MNASALAADVIGLTNGTPYWFTVVARTAYGDGPASDQSPVIVPGPMQRGWSVVGPLFQARYSHTATLLDGSTCTTASPPAYCGKVLVAGGSDSISGPGQHFYADADLYAPKLRSWSSAKALTDCSRSGGSCLGRSSHTATVLDGPACRSDPSLKYCGAVLVVGGRVSESDATPTSELYSPSTDTWTPGPSLSVPSGATTAARQAHTATLLDPPGCHGVAPAVLASYPCGQVLIAGGTSTADLSDSGSIASAELYDPAANHGFGGWKETTSPMGTPRAFHSATLLSNGKVMVAGGLGAHSSTVDNVASTSSAEIFDPAAADGSFQWTATGSMAQARFSHSASALWGPACVTGEPPAYCGRVLVAGGVSDFSSGDPIVPTGFSTFRDGAELYDPVTGSWRATGSLHDARAGHTASTLPDGRILVTGGGSSVETNSSYHVVKPSTSEIYDPAVESWTYTSSLHYDRGLHSATVLDGPECRGDTPPEYCGKVLVAGGAGEGPATCSGKGDPRGFCPHPVATTELYDRPSVSGVTPSGGASQGGTTVTVSGLGFTVSSSVTFDGIPASEVSYRSPNSLAVVTPPHAGGPAIVVVANSGGSSAVTEASRFLYDGCGSPRAGQIAYPANAYSLVGLPGGSIIPSDSFLYQWSDQGAGGAYIASDPKGSPVVSGRGYWAWFSCSRSIDLPVSSPPSSSAQLAAGHASIVGDASSVSASVVTGQDFAATWDPSMNGGAGGYQVSNYRSPVSLSVGQGAWVFSYEATFIAIRPGG